MAKLTKKQQKEQEKVLIEKSKNISIAEGSAYSFMDGFGLRYVTPYALAAGANNAQIGLLSSLPALLGNLSQLFTIKAMRKFSRKTITFWGVFLQAIMWLFLIAAGSFYFIFNVKDLTSGYAIIIIYTLLILVGSFASPSWSSWMRDLVTENRGDYFGRRNRIAGSIALVCMLIAGFILDYFRHTQIYIGFAILFFIAFLGRFASSLFMLKQYEPKFKQDKRKYFTFFAFIKKMWFNNFGKFVLYYSLIYFAVNISGPFGAVYMLKNLNFNYVQFIAVTLSSSVASLMFMPFWGKFADRYGNLRVMKINSLLIPFVPLLWMVSALIPAYALIYLFIVELFSGLVWAGFNLAAGNFIYDAVTKQRLAICVCYFNLIAGAGTLIGASLGGIIASYNFVILGLTPILFIFALSGIARLAVHFLMTPKIQEVRKVEEFNIKEAENKIKNLSLKNSLNTWISEYFRIIIILNSL